jgi:hypothetical protein
MFGGFMQAQPQSKSCDEKTGKLTGRETIFKLAKALGVSVQDLLRE